MFDPFASNKPKDRGTGPYNVKYILGQQLLPDYLIENPHARRIKRLYDLRPGIYIVDFNGKGQAVISITGHKKTKHVLVYYPKGRKRTATFHGFSVIVGSVSIPYAYYGLKKNEEGSAKLFFVRTHTS